MTPHLEDEESYEFGKFILSLKPLKLQRDGHPVNLRNRGLKLLALLVQRAGSLITHEEIRAALWEDRQVDVSRGIHVCIGEVRQALGDTSEDPRYLETLPRQGYRFICPVRSIAPSNANQPNGSFKSFTTKQQYARLAAITLLIIGVCGGWILFTREPKGEPAHNGAAEEFYQKAQYLLGLGDWENLQKSERLFAQAIGRDGNYASAYIGLAEVLFRKGQYGEARIQTLKALSISPDLAEGNLLLGRIALWGEWDWNKAEQLIEESIALDPGNAKAYMSLGWLRIIQGRPNDALLSANEAYVRDPVSSLIKTGYGLIHYYSKDYYAALRLCEEASELAPENSQLLYCQLSSALETKQYQTAGKVAVLLLDESARNSELAEKLQNASSRASFSDFFSWYKQHAEDLVKEKNVNMVELTDIYAQVGDYGLALTALKKGLDSHYSLVPLIVRDPLLKPLHTNPEYLKLMTYLDLD